MANRTWDLTTEEYMKFMQEQGYEINPRFLEVKDREYYVKIAQADTIHGGPWAAQEKLNDFLEEWNRPDSPSRAVPVSLSMTTSQNKLGVDTYTAAMIWESIPLYYKPCQVSDADYSKWRHQLPELEVDDEVYQKEKEEKALLERQAQELMAMAEGVDGL